MNDNQNPQVSPSDYEHLWKREQMMNNCLAALIQENDINDALQYIVRQICEFMDADASMVLKLDGASNQGRIIASFEREDNSQVLKQLERTVLSPIQVAFKHYLDNVTLVLDDITVFSQYCGICSQLACKTALKKMYGVRLMVNDKVWGSVLVFFIDGTRTIPDDEFMRLQTFSHMAELSIMRHEYRKNLVTERDMALEAEKIKNFFFASVSHNIRTPLNAIQGFAELLQLGGLETEEAQMYLENLKTGVNMMMEQVEDVLDLSRLKSGKMTFVSTPCEFTRLGLDVMKLFVFQAKEKGIRLLLDIKAMPVLSMDVARVKQVLVNLLVNALKYTQEGTITLEAEYHRENFEQGTLMFSVSDTGIGISEQDQIRLSQPYMQLEDFSEQIGGSGLGLTICKAMVSEMGGNVWLRSKLGEGSTFGVTLPKIQCQAGGMCAALEQEISG